MPLSYSVPEIQDNADGWGPSQVPDHLKDIPFSPFSKSDRLGKAADWSSQGYNKNYQGRFQQSGPAVFSFVHNEEEDSFHLVDNRPKQQPKFGNKRFQQQRFQQQRREREARQDGGREKPTKQQQQKKNQWGNWRDQQRQIQYSSSVEIRPEWAVKEQIPFASLLKLSCQVGEPETLHECGTLEYYDKTFDKVSARLEKPLERTKRVFRNVTTSDDPIIRQLAAEDKARVFVTDNILTTLMCVKSSVYSWDVVITRVGDKLFLDKRDGGSLDLLTVNETAPDQLPEEKDNINGVQNLSLEATTINQNYGQQVLIKDAKKYELGPNPNPFLVPGEEEELTSSGYRYRKWTLNADEGLDVVVRCELDGVIENKGEEQVVSIKALNEFDLKATDWRKKLESQRGAVLAFETKNNKNKIAKWTVGALLSGAEMIKLGYVSRAGPKDNQNHVILGTQACKPKEFASQIFLSMDHCWGIVRALIDLLLKLDEGKYLLVKDPNKELLRLYAVPEDAFETNYTEEPLEDEDAVPADKTTLLRPAADEAADE